MEYAVLEFKLMVISDNFSDQEVEEAFLDTVIETETDIIEVLGILSRERPELYEKIKSRIKNLKI